MVDAYPARKLTPVQGPYQEATNGSERRNFLPRELLMVSSQYREFEKKLTQHTRTYAETMITSNTLLIPQELILRESLRKRTRQTPTRMSSSHCFSFASIQMSTRNVSLS